MALFGVEKGFFDQGNRAGQVGCAVQFLFVRLAEPPAPTNDYLAAGTEAAAGAGLA